MELKIVLLALCVGFVCGASYKAAVVDKSIEFNENKAVSMIEQAAQLNVDFLMLPEMVASSTKIRQLSDAAKEASIYVTAQILDNTISGTKTNYLFDRNGTVISNPSDTFLADFGVIFSLVNVEDLLMTDAGARNVIAFGSAPTQFLYALQSSGAWAYTTRSNLITARAIYGGQTHKHGGLVVAELNSDRPNTFEEQNHHITDLSQVTSEPLRGSGRKQVCHEEFCCDFDITTKSALALPYSLVSYSGVQDIGAGPVRVETCALVACSGQQESCFEELERNKTNVFEKLTISAYFSANSKQYPVVISSDVTFDDVTFIQRNQSNHASVELIRKQITSLGIFGISKDLETQDMRASDDMSELFDYLWIRLRVAIFIISIYVLEMM
ncbi:uncharacterized protein LOC121727850 [Aricia agestis]|uniref:uncharacterized protein LOC121727850 n=1 Tax=Aricia agestis TaxID=91739 RepID=UPI001C206F4D|nr:uncharacterized protein LOC121727850 [Aricia agestis]